MLSRVTLIYPSFLGAPTETHGNLVYKLIIKLCARDMAAGSHGPAESLSKGAYVFSGFRGAFRTSGVRRAN
jgi:hypothetical protein